MKHFLLHTACLLFSFSAFSQKSLILSGAYLPCKDYTVQRPDGGQPSAYTIGISSGFELQAGFPLQHGFRFETGYRMKQHWLTYRFAVGAVSHWNQTTHSCPLRIGYERSLGTRKWLAPFSLSVSAGALVDILQLPPKRRTFSNFAFTTADGPFLSGYDFKNTTGRVSASFDGYAQLNCKLFRSFQFFLGTGYTRGVRPLAKGTFYNHNISANTTVNGTIYTKGAYRYMLLGVRYSMSLHSQQASK